MSGQISKAESWSTVYKAYQNINFSAYDYDSVKRSLLDYVKTYHPENFNDYIENSELVALIEVFAYISQQLAYRQDMNAHENFITLANRKQSVLQLAKYISYNAARNLPPRGLVKVTSVQTTEEVYDSKGNNLANKRVTWNDTNNANWKEQFFIITNLITEQRYGSVAPADRVQVDDVVFELYRLKNRPLQTGVLTYTATSSGQTYPMELVPTALNTDGPYERRPAKNSTFSMLYGADGLGDSSDTTGFFMFTKQGVLNKIAKTFDGITPNQTLVLGVNNINDTDVWVNNTDPDTGLTYTDAVIDPLGRRLNPLGEWVPVDAANVENVIYNTNLNRNKYELETLENDDVRIIFGDGEFADVPSGTFDFWYRTSTAGEGVILQNSVVNQSTALTYLDTQQKLQNFTFTFSLVSSLTNGAASEDIERIRRFAPSIYYTQDRMVNGRDYNNYLLQNQSIAKLRAINRTFAGESKYLAWHDPSEYYEDVKIFGDDLTVYYTSAVRHDELVNSAPLFFIRSTVQPLLVTVGVYLSHALKYIPAPTREFNAIELGTLSVNSDNTILGEMQKGLVDNPGNFIIYLCYRPVYSGSVPLSSLHRWVTFNENDARDEPSIVDEASFTLTYFRNEDKWRVDYNYAEQIVRSPTTQFWFNNGEDKTIVEDTLNSELDEILLLKANVDTKGSIFTRNVPISVVGSAYTSSFPAAGQQDPYALSVMSPDVDGDGVPDDLAYNEVLAETMELQSAGPVSLINIDFGTSQFKDVVAGYNQLVMVINNKRFVTDTSTEALVGIPQALYTFSELVGSGPVASRKTAIQSITNSGDRPVDYEDRKPGTAVTGIRLTLTTSTGTTDGDGEYNAFIARLPLNIKVYKRNHAYFYKESSDDTEWIPATALNLPAIRASWLDSTNRSIVKQAYGMNALNFAWFHRTPRYHIVDPSVTNIIDMFIVTRGYYNQLRSWLRGDIQDQPVPPTAMELRTSFQQTLEARMMSDAVVVHPGRFKILFGAKSISQLRATFKVIRSPNATTTANEMKVNMVEIIRNFFSVDNWEFGETFYFSELSAAIHAGLTGEIDSVVLVPQGTDSLFGDMFELQPQEDELFIPDVTVDNIELVDHLSSRVLKQ